MTTVWDGIRRIHGSAVENAKRITVPLLARMIEALPHAHPASGAGGHRS